MLPDMLSSGRVLISLYRWQNKYLQPFSDFTDFFQGEKYVTLAHVAHRVTVLVDHLSGVSPKLGDLLGCPYTSMPPAVCELHAHVLAKMRTWDVTTPLALMGAMTHPGFKSLSFLPALTKNGIKLEARRQMLIEMACAQRSALDLARQVAARAPLPALPVVDVGKKRKADAQWDLVDDDDDEHDLGVRYVAVGSVLCPDSVVLTFCARVIFFSGWRASSSGIGGRAGCVPARQVVQKHRTEHVDGWRR